MRLWHALPAQWQGSLSCGELFFLSYDGRINILEIVIIIRMHYNHIYI